VSDPTIRIGEHETVAITRAALPDGTHTFTVHSAGNAVLSSVYVRSGAGTAEVRWYDYGASNDETLAARVELQAHPALAAGGKSRLLVTRIHANARVEVVVAGGGAEVMVLATMVADFPVDLASGALDGATANLGSDEGLPIAVYDPAQGKFFLLRGPGGYIATDPEGPGEGKVLEAPATALPAPGGSPIVLATGTVPAGKTWRLRYGEVVCRGYGRWALTVDGARKAGGVTSAAREHDRVDLPLGMKATAGQVVAISYTYSHGPAGIDADGFIGLTEVS